MAPGSAPCKELGWGSPFSWRFMALAKGVNSVFGEGGIIQRCILHKERNVLSYLPKKWKGRPRDKAKGARVVWRQPQQVMAHADWQLPTIHPRDSPRFPPPPKRSLWNSYPPPSCCPSACNPLMVGASSKQDSGATEYASLIAAPP